MAVVHKQSRNCLCRLKTAQTCLKPQTGIRAPSARGGYVGSDFGSLDVEADMRVLTTMGDDDTSGSDSWEITISSLIFSIVFFFFCLLIKIIVLLIFDRFDSSRFVLFAVPTLRESPTLRLALSTNNVDCNDNG